jgi:type IV secretory pathway TraG/TraD family ATPase VirD4
MSQVSGVGSQVRLVEGSSTVHGLPHFPRASIEMPTATGAIPISDELLSQHILLIGGIGQGKTNAIYHLLAGLRRHMTSEDIAVIFDPKGDYHKTFFRPGDIVINDPDLHRTSDVNPWNLLAEVRASSHDREETTNEIAHTLFDEAIEHSSQPFFPMAAKDLFGAVLHYLAQRTGTSNAQMVRFWNNPNTLKNLQAVIKSEKDKAGLANYIDSAAAAQAQGVMASVIQVVGGLFVGRFADEGTLSIRETIRKKQRRCIFLEYDVSTGKALAPIYKVLVDLAIKEALSRHRVAGRVFFVIDEFRLLPHLMHMDHGVNFGRSEGAHFIIGMQNIAQVRAAYESEAASILSAFNTVFAFRVTDDDTRTFVKGIAGRNRKLVSVPSVVAGPPIQEMTEGNVVEDHEVWSLRPGEAICFFPGAEAPFRTWLHLFKASL